MTTPLLGIALIHSGYETLRDWIRADGRAIEIQDFIGPDILSADHSDLVSLWKQALVGHEGPRGLHGPFFGLNLSNPDPDIRQIIRKRLTAALDVADALGADQMVVHSPYTFWHVLNRWNYAAIRPQILIDVADCLEPVLKRAADIGCTIVVENIDDTDPTDRVDLVRAIDHPNLKVSLDTGHAELAHGQYGAPPVVDFIEAAAGYLAHVHIQDADGYADRHWHPGEGRVPWRAVFGALSRLDVQPRLLLELRGDLAKVPQTVARLAAEGLAR